MLLLHELAKSQFDFYLENFRVMLGVGAILKTPLESFTILAEGRRTSEQIQLLPFNIGMIFKAANTID